MEGLYLNEIARAINGTLINCTNYDLSVKGVSTDSREELIGKLFVPLKGESFDGHSFIEEAFKKGAVCSLCETGASQSANPLILVESTHKALKDLAEYYRGLFKAKVIAITGSVGKTTTKDMIASVLSQKYICLKTEGNFNNEIGLPLTMFRLEKETEVAVIEMGMNNFNEIQALSKIARPDIAMITNIGYAHIENLKSREGILKAKCEIFDFLRSNGEIIINGDDDMLSTLAYERQLVFGYKLAMPQEKGYWRRCKEKSGYDFFATDIKVNNLSNTQCKIHTNKGEAFEVTIPIPGMHMVYTALAATAVGMLLGLTCDEIKAGIMDFRPSKNRMEIVKQRNLTIINDAYNASPDSMMAAINVLSEQQGRKIAILGDMKELGKFSQSLHFDLGRYIKDKGLTSVYCIGSQAFYIYKALEQPSVVYYNDETEFLEELPNFASLGDTTVLVKASRAMRFEKIVKAIQEQMASGL